MFRSPVHFECPARRYDPSPEDLDIGRLMMMLGRFLDTKYMSIDMPPSARENVPTCQLPFKVSSRGATCGQRTMCRAPLLHWISD